MNENWAHFMYPVTENNELALENKGFCVVASIEIHLNILLLVRKLFLYISHYTKYIKYQYNMKLFILNWMELQAVHNLFDIDCLVSIDYIFQPSHFLVSIQFTSVTHVLMSQSTGQNLDYYYPLTLFLLFSFVIKLYWAMWY